MVKRWRKATLISGAIPTGNLGVAVTAFFTWCYAAAVHKDPTDKDLTAAIRIYRHSSEHKWAHHFYYLTLGSASTAPTPDGVLVKQASGTVWLFDARRFPHGTTIAKDGVRPRESLGMVLVQKKGMLHGCSINPASWSI
jgi:hypothetical protein